MTYHINFLDRTIAIEEETIDQTTTPLRLIGRDWAGYGEQIAQNFVDLLQNYASGAAADPTAASEPVNPIDGQLWFDAGTTTLKLRSDLQWINLASQTFVRALTINITGSDMSGTGTASSVPVTLKPFGTAGTYYKVSVDSKGRVSSGQTTLSYADMVDISPPLAGPYNKVWVNSKGFVISGTTTTLSNGDLPLSGVAAGTYTKVTVNDRGIVTAGTQFIIANSDLPNSGVAAGTYTRVSVNAKGIVTTADQAPAPAATDLSGLLARQYPAGNGLLGSIGTWTTGLTDIDSYDNIFAKSGVYAPVMQCDTMYGIATHANYSDLAERYETDAIYSIGTLVKIGGDKEITQTIDCRDCDVLGIISENPGLLMNSKAGNDETHPSVGLIGRLPIRTLGRVKKGDALVSSEIPGVAQSIGKPKRDVLLLFARIGTALEDKDTDDEGLLLAFIGKRG